MPAISKQLSVVLPCYHPAADWQAHIIAGYQEIAATIGLHPELIIVDDGNETPISEKASEIKARIPGVSFIRYTPNRGKGYALRQGVAAATGEWIIYTDVDFPYLHESFLAIYRQLAAGTDVAIGVKDAAYYQSVPLMRRIISKSLRQMIGLLLDMPITDTQCGLKGFNRKGSKYFLGTTIDRYLFDLEFVSLCFRKYTGLQVAAVPVSLRPGVHFRKMNYKILLPELKNFLAVWRKKGSREALADRS